MELASVLGRKNFRSGQWGCSFPSQWSCALTRCTLGRLRSKPAVQTPIATVNEVCLFGTPSFSEHSCSFRRFCRPSVRWTQGGGYQVFFQGDLVFTTNKIPILVGAIPVQTHPAARSISSRPCPSWTTSPTPLSFSPDSCADGPKTGSPLCASGTPVKVLFYSWQMVNGEWRRMMWVIQSVLHTVSRRCEWHWCAQPQRDVLLGGF